MESLNKQLKKMRKTSEPKKAFKKELWSELSVAFDEEYPAMLFSFKRAFTIPLAALILFVTMGTGVYAYSSPEVTESSRLYPIKRGMEAVEGKFHVSPEASSKFHAKMVERRIEEGEVMLRRGQISKDQLEKIANEFDVTVEQIIKLKHNPEAREEFRNEVIEKMNTQNQRFEHLFERSGEIDQKFKEEGNGTNGLRNKLQEIRVRINESDLPEEEKRALFPKEIESVNN